MCIVASASQEQPSSKYYDEVYFDSDDSSSVEDMREADGEGGGAPAVGKGKQEEGEAKKVKKLTNDELFYDPNMDDDDEKWVNRKRMAYHNGEVRGAYCLECSGLPLVWPLLGLVKVCPD